jgi:hypothetical protein
MKTLNSFRCHVSLWLVVLAGWGDRCPAADTALTYQGVLRVDDAPADGSYDLTFQLFDAADGGTAVGPLLTNRAVTLRQGLLSTELDFDPLAFNGAARWLQIGVRRAGATQDFSGLRPRTRLAPVAEALHVRRADDAARAELASGVVPGSITTDSLAAQSVTADRIAQGQVVRSLNKLHDDITLVAGANVTLTPGAQQLTIGSSEDWKLGGNAGTLAGTHFIGTTDRQPLELHVAGARGMRLEPTAAPGVVNVVIGSRGNVIDPVVSGSTIAGGGASYEADGGQYVNRIDSSFGAIGGGWANWIEGGSSSSVIGGGQSNRIATLAFESVIMGGRGNTVSEDAFEATIGGGGFNTVGAAASTSVIAGGMGNLITGAPVYGYHATISGGASNTIATGSHYASIGGGGNNRIAEDSFSGVIGGGGDNSIESASPRSTIAGGKFNRIGSEARHSTIGGGATNRIDLGAEAATIPGGAQNYVGGAYALAAGRQAQAIHQGSFVWADSNDLPFASLQDDEFAVRAVGGVRLVTGIDGTGQPAAGVAVAAGGGSWSNLSDRAAKHGFQDVDPVAILEGVLRLPVQTWSYRTQPDNVRHLGPTAGDFRAAFGLGEDPRYIAAVDADGVALAALQGLYQLLEAKDARITQLERRLELLERQRAHHAAVEGRIAD